MGKIINGYEVLDPLSDEEVVYMWDKYDLIDNYSGKWITWKQYLERDRLYPYSPTDIPRSHLVETFNKERKNNSKKTELVKVLHPPIYFSITGEELPGNGVNPLMPQKEKIDINEFNYYSGGSFFTVIKILFIICLLCTFFINSGWILWIPYIIYCIYGYKKWIKYTNKF